MKNQIELLITPDLVSKEYFCATTHISERKLLQHISNGKVLKYKDGKNTLVDIKKYYQDVKNGKFELEK